VSFPLGLFIAVTGVSGSGKSTLVNDILYTVAGQAIYTPATCPAGIAASPAPSSSTRSSTSTSRRSAAPAVQPATYTGVFDHMRKLFAQTSEAKVRGYLPGPVLLQRQGRALRGLLR
jgi:excinuclease ABC subunit A